MNMRRGARLAGAVFVLTWVPLSVWRGLRFGRTFRFGPEGSQSSGPLIEGIIQLSAVMLAPAAFAALIAFVLWAWREERRAP
jgi:hypothetical protein